MANPRLGDDGSALKALKLLQGCDARPYRIELISRPMSGPLHQHVAANLCAPAKGLVHMALRIRTAWSHGDNHYYEYYILELFPAGVKLTEYPDYVSMFADYRWTDHYSIDGTESVDFICDYLDHNKDRRYNRATYNCQRFAIDLYNSNPHLWVWQRAMYW